MPYDPDRQLEWNQELRILVIALFGLSFVPLLVSFFVPPAESSTFGLILTWQWRADFLLGCLYGFLYLWRQNLLADSAIAMRYREASFSLRSRTRPRN